MPVVGGVSPTMMRMVVDLPAPLGPRKPVTRPGAAVKVTSSTAVKAAVPLGHVLDGDHVRSSRGCMAVMVMAYAWV